MHKPPFFARFCLKAPTTSQALGLLQTVICPGSFDRGGYDEARIPKRLAVSTNKRASDTDKLQSFASANQ